MPFYGERHKTNGFMSNFYPCNNEIIVPTTDISKDPDIIKKFGETIKFGTSEQLFMFLKGITFYDRNKKENMKVLIDIANEFIPRNVKKLGRRLYCQTTDGSEPFDKMTWEKECCKCMYDACYYKFTQNPDLRKQLKATKNLHLVEATKNDRIWGCGIDIGNPSLNDKNKWIGTNLLGETLMVLRDEL